MNRETKIVAQRALQPAPLAFRHPIHSPHLDLIPLNPTKSDLKKFSPNRRNQTNPFSILPRFRCFKHLLKTSPLPLQKNEPLPIPVALDGSLLYRRMSFVGRRQRLRRSKSPKFCYSIREDAPAETRPCPDPPNRFLIPNFSLNSMPNTATMRVRFVATCSYGPRPSPYFELK
jgi:hypothetical protein